MTRYGMPFSFQGKFHCVGLGVGAAWNGVVQIFPGERESAPTKLPRCPRRRLRIPERVALRIGCQSFFPLRPRLWAITALAAVRMACRGTVVLFQTNDPRAPVVFKVQNVFHGRAPEAVNALVVVAHHADVLVIACKAGDVKRYAYGWCPDTKSPAHTGICADNTAKHPHSAAKAER